MSDRLLRLSDADLQEFVRALRANRLEAPFTPMTVRRVTSSPDAAPIAAELQQLADKGFSPEQLATMIELIARARGQRTVTEDLIDFVATGPEAPGVSNRDTGVVVREMFTHASRSVLVAGYAVYQGQRVFEALGDRMEEVPELQVRLILDVQRGPGETAVSREIVRCFGDRFRTRQWPRDRRLPEVFYDPRSLEADSQKRACMHAKCVVVDRKDVFVSSANFTVAAQERNLEVGLLIHSASLAERVAGHFEALLAARHLQSVF